MPEAVHGRVEQWIAQRLEDVQAHQVAIEVAAAVEIRDGEADLETGEGVRRCTWHDHELDPVPGRILH